MSAAVGDAPLVIFDCDGVLVESELLVVEIEAELLRTVGIELSPLEVAEHFVGLSEVAMNELIRERWGVELTESFLEDKAARIRDAFDTDLRPVEGIGALLTDLGHRRCVASSALPTRIEQSLTLCGLRQHFDDLFSSSMVERGKPAPDLFLHAAATMGVPPERCVVVEDSPFGVEAGRAAGMTVIGFLAGGHGPPSFAGRLAGAGADRIAHTTQELGAVLAQVLRELPAG